MINLEPFRSDIEIICRELDSQRLDLIGSSVHNDSPDESDVDVLVTFKGNENIFDRYFSLKESLEKVFKRKVDVIEERVIRNPFFRRAVNKDRVIVYGETS